MRVFVAGATGVIGRRLLPLLTSQGHEVIGLARSYGAAVEVELLGAVAAEADALDSGALSRVVKDAAPNAVVHLLTAIPARINPRRMSRDLAQTTGFALKAPATSCTPPNIHPGSSAPVLAALRSLEERTRQADGLVLRLGQLYGHGTIYGRHGSIVRQVQAAKMPLIGSGNGTFSFTHVGDAASAVAAALRSQVGGALNVVDDEPAPIREWLPILAEMLEAPHRSTYPLPLPD